MKRKKKSNRQKLVKELDVLWSLLVRKINPRCIMCGTDRNLHAHHCIVRKAQSNGVRWLLKNGVSLCAGEHLYKLHGQQSDKAWLDRYVRTLDRLIPIEEQEEIIEIGHKTTKFSINELQRLRDSFKRRLNV